MTILMRLLTALVGGASALRPQSSPTVPLESNTPMSLRLPPEVRVELQVMAERMGLSLHQTVVMGLTALTALDPLALQVSLMCGRVRHLAQSHRLDAMEMQRLVPQLTPDTFLTDELLARVLTPEVVKHLSDIFAVSQHWLIGKDTTAAQHAWYVEPGSPIAWVKQHGVERVTVYWHAARNARWLIEQADILPEGTTTPEREYDNHLGLIVEVTPRNGPLHRIVQAWKPEAMDYQKSRTVARIIATRLHELGVRQVGMYVRLEDYRGLANGTLLPSDVLRDRVQESWLISEVLLIGQGLYQSEDGSVDGYYNWAGVHEIQALTVKPLR